jgi:hypothetical protein
MSYSAASMRTFDPNEMAAVAQAVEIAEDVTANYFKISTSDWRHVRYDIGTLATLTAEEITSGAFAQITRYSRFPGPLLREARPYEFFKICLQDHTIAAALERDENLRLFPLMVYVATHELVHVVRFCKFLQRFDAEPDERLREEIRVHEITQRALGNVGLAHMDYVVQGYRSFDFMEVLRDQRLSS